MSFSQRVSSNTFLVAAARKSQEKSRQTAALGGTSGRTRVGPCHCLQRRERRVEGLAGTHDRADLLAVREVVATDVGRLALHRIELVDDLLLAVGERIG